MIYVNLFFALVCPVLFAASVYKGWYEGMVLHSVAGIANWCAVYVQVQSL